MLVPPSGVGVGVSFSPPPKKRNGSFPYTKILTIDHIEAENEHTLQTTMAVIRWKRKIDYTPVVGEKITCKKKVREREDSSRERDRERERELYLKRERSSS